MAAGASASAPPSAFGDAIGDVGDIPLETSRSAASRERRSDALRVAAVAPGGLSFIPDASPFFWPWPPVSAAAKAAARSASAALRATAAASRAAAFCSRLVGARGFASRGAFAGFSFGGGGAGRGRTRQSSSFSSRRFSVSRPGMRAGPEASSEPPAFPARFSGDESRSSCFKSRFFPSGSGPGGAHSSSAKSRVGSTRIFSNCASRSSADQGEKPCLSEPRRSAASVSADHHVGSAPRCTFGLAKSPSAFSAGGELEMFTSTSPPTLTSSAAESAALSLPHLAARCHPLASLLYRFARSSAASAFSGMPARRSSIAASHTSTVCSQVARDMPTGTPPSSTPPPRASISAATSGGSFRHERGAVSVPQRPFFMLSHTSHRASAAAPPASPAFALNSACSRSSSSARALFTLAVRSIISARHDATARACLNGRRSAIASSAALVARTHAPSTPTPNDTSASSRAFRSRSSHASVFFAADFAFAILCLEARFAPRVARSSSSSPEKSSSSPEKSSSSPRRRLVFLPTIPTAPSLYESYMPLRLRGPVTRKRSSRPRSASCPNAVSASRAAFVASGSALAQKSSASKSSSSPAAEKTAVEKVFPARAPMARCSARLPRIWSMSSFSNAAASSPELSRRAPCTPYLSSRLIFAASSLADFAPAPPSAPSPPPSTASSSPYFFAEVSNRLCSYVALVTSRYTFTSLVCPMRWQRAIACRSFCGFQSLS